MSQATGIVAARVQERRAEEALTRVTRRACRGSMAALCLVILAAPLASVDAAGYPDRPITLVVGAAPGGGTDMTARALAEPLSAALGQSIVIENKPGASGNIGTSYAARVKPDGYTLLMQFSGGHVAPHLIEKITWQHKDFTPIALVALSPHILAVRPGIKAKDLKELADLAKADPGGLRYGSAGNGSIQHLAMEIFSEATGTRLLHVPYKSAAPAVVDLLGGQIDIVVNTPTSLITHVRAGKAVALAYTADKRHPQFPEIATSAEAGLPNYEVVTWFGVWAPAQTPPDIVERLAADIKKSIASEGFRTQIENQGGFVNYKGPAEFKAFIDSDFVYWGKVIESVRARSAAK